MAGHGSPDLNSPLDVASVAMHELFTSLRRAGFTRSEAITIIAKTAAEIVAQQVAEQTGEGDDEQR